MTPPAKLIWQCRRGTLELDWVLTRYLQADYGQADSEEQASFEVLLQRQDDELLALLTGDNPPDAGKLSTLVAKLRKGINDA